MQLSVGKNVIKATDVYLMHNVSTIYCLNILYILNKPNHICTALNMDT